MKHLITLFAILITVSVNAQWSFNTTSGTGIESPTNTASGFQSTAMGYYTTASGDASNAMGQQTTASGYNSTAMGGNTQAIGSYSTAMGYYTTASGDLSTTMGFRTTASDRATLAIGQYNTDDTTPNNAFSPANRAFIIGNGANSGAKSDAMTVLFDGTTTIAGSVTATSFTGDGSGLTNLPAGFSGSYNDLTDKPTLRDITTSNPVVFGDLAAFSGTFVNKSTLDLVADTSGDLITGYFNGLAGDRFNVKLNDNNNYAQVSSGGGYNLDFYSEGGEMNFVGEDIFTSPSFSFNGDVSTTGSVTATSFTGDGSGLTNLPAGFSGDYGDLINTPLNFNTLSFTGIESPTNTASGNRSTAMGVQTTASGPYSTAMGLNTIASGYASTAMGRYTQASGDSSTAMGYFTEASGDASTAMGGVTTASGYSSTAMGVETTASGDSSTAMGYFTEASDFGTLAIGRYNSDDTSPNPGSFSLANRAFIIGNGGDASNKSDAMTVLFDGTTTIAGDLTINSDARLKSNIISLGSTLAKLLSLDGKSYTFKTDETKQKIGLLAQDVQDVFPELVKEGQDEKGILSVNYQGLIPVLINAIKEQQSEIELLKEQVKALKKD